jgi:hypothetical protein
LKKLSIILTIMLLSFLMIAVSVKAVSHYFPQGALIHTLPAGVFVYDSDGLAYNPDTGTYWSISGGTTPSNIYEQSPNGTFLINGSVPLDGRAIVYRPEDGNIYIRTYNGGLYRLNLPFNGTVTQVLPDIFQNEQCGFIFANGGNIFDVYNGLVKEYDFATGNELRNFTLSPLYPSNTTYPYDCQIASNGTDLYFLSEVDDVYVYDMNGNFKAIVSLNHPTFDDFEAPFSFSYANERIYAMDTSDGTWYGYRIMGFPAITLVPNTGFASTTVNGSGFAPNSEINITWDGTVIPTVPSPLTTDSYGNFTAIISVLAPNDPGDHIVKVTDESGNSEEATFTVIDMTGPEGEIGPQGETGPQGPEGATGPAGEVSIVYIAVPTALSIVAIVLAALAVARKKP